METASVPQDPDRLLSKVERLTNLTLSRLEEGCGEKLLSPSEVRLLSVVALRCMKLWRELRRDDLRHRKRTRKELQPAEELSENGSD